MQFIPDNITTGTVTLEALKTTNADNGFIDDALSTAEVVLASSRYIPTSNGIHIGEEDKVTVQMLCTNLSGDTTFSPEISVDGVIWDVAQESGTDITHTLVDDATFVQTYESQRGMYWRWAMAGVTTGTVAATLMGGTVIAEPAT